MQQDALSPILKQAEISNNPNSTPKGVIVFASLTMPETSLRQLMIQSAELQVPIVIRGVLPGASPRPWPPFNAWFSQTKRQPSTVVSPSIPYGSSS